MGKILITAVLIAIFVSACRDTTIVGPVNNNNNGFNKILTGESGDSKFELYDSTANKFVTGYNNIGIKVFINGEEKTSGFVKLKIKMYHTFITSSHTTPISPVFYYDQNKKMFTGYTSMLMYTDSTSYCMAFFNYNDEKFVDSVRFLVDLDTTEQTRGFIDFPSSTVFIITLISPKNPGIGLHDFKCLFHRTIDDQEYYEVDSAQMFLRTLLQPNGYSSAGNINPVSLGNGLYHGKINLDSAGTWLVYDSVKYHDRIITPANTPKFNFKVQ